MGGEVGAHSGFQRQLSKLHSSSGFLHANSLIYLELRTLLPRQEAPAADFAHHSSQRIHDRESA